MCTLYESIKSLCDAKGVKPGKMCVDLKISKSTMTDLKSGRRSGVSMDTAQKIADYFGVSVDRVLGSGQKEKPALSEEDERKAVDEFLDGLTPAELVDLISKASAKLKGDGVL